MKTYSSIKELVLDAYTSEGCMPSYETLTPLVRQFFPHSRWKESHYAWYKSQIKTGKIPLPDELPENSQSEGDIDADIEESFETRASLERDVRDYLVSRLQELEPGLVLHDNGVEHQTDAGRIDILAVDAHQQMVVVEVKAGKARDRALGQLLGYIGCLSCQPSAKSQIRGILVANDFDSRVVYACKNLPNIKLLKYKLSFTFNRIT